MHNGRLNQATAKNTEKQIKRMQHTATHKEAVSNYE